MQLSDDEQVLPLRSAVELREEVAHRVMRARRRRRIQRAGIPGMLAVVVVVVALLVGHVPGGETSLQTPASERSQDESVDAGSANPAAGPGAPGTVPSTTPPPTVPSGILPTPAPVPRDNARDTVATPHYRLAVTRNDELWEFTDDGKPVRKLVSRSVSDSAWSPNGRYLTYATFDGGLGSTSISVLDLQTMQTRVIVGGTDATYDEPTFSADGRFLAYTRGPRTTSTPPSLDDSVVVVDLDTPDGNGDGGSKFTGQSPSWSPDGRLVYRCGRYLCIADADGSHSAQIPNSSEFLDPRWSPDGGWIAGTDYSTGDTQVIRPDGSGRRSLARDSGSAGVAWSPDGLRVFYPTAYGLRSIAIDGSDLRLVTDRFDGWVSATRL